MDPSDLQSQLQTLLGPFLSQLRPSQAQPAEATQPLIAPLPLGPSASNHQPPAQPPLFQPSQTQPAITSQAPRPQRASILPSIPAYQSARVGAPAPPSQSFSANVGLGYPSIQRSNPSAPFLGFENTRQANQQRLTSASASLPRRPTLVPRAIRATSSPSLGSAIRGRRPRGRAGRPPSLPSATTINDVTFHDASADAHFLRVRCKIYPPLGEHGQGLFVYLHHRDSFNEALKNKDLLFDLDVPVTSTIGETMSTICEGMRNGRHAYHFEERREHGTHVLPHEAHVLGLLRIVNRGRPRASTGQISLQVQPMINNTTLEHLVTEQAARFVVPEISFEDKRFVLFFSVLGRTLTARTPSASLGEPPRLHRCISQTIYTRFPNDRYDNSEFDDLATSGGETDASATDMDDSDSDEEMAVISELTPPPLSQAPLVSTRRRAVRTRPRMRTLEAGDQAPIIHRSISAPTADTQTQPLAAIALAPVATNLPASLWSTSWVKPQVEEETVDLSDLDLTLFELASGYHPPKLELSGESVQDLANGLFDAISLAIDANDFERILSTEREFIITRPAGNHQQIRSLGRGVEREVVHVAFEHYRKDASQWFVQRAGGYSSIAVTNMMTQVPSTRLRRITILGALTSLMLIHGMAPTPLSPVLIHYFIHNCDLQSIYPSFLAEWIPDLHETLKRWLAVDPTSKDISEFRTHFASYHDVEIACLRDRDASSHSALASEMLYRAVVGSELGSQEIQAFFKGFQMECPRTGFKFTDIRKLVEGGSESFLNMVWTSHIKSYEDIEPQLRFTSATTLNLPAAVLSSYNTNGPLTFKHLVEVFLKGSGIPCPGLFAEAQHHFNSSLLLLPMDKIGEQSFRPRIFCWAATGSPSIEINGSGISISLCGPLDSDYAIPSRREVMMREGKICFKTCSKEVKVPLLYLEKLAGATYSAETEPTSFQVAFEHWLLCELLNAIGNHSIL